MNDDRYVLVGQTPVPEPDLMTWARSFEESDRHVAVTRVLDIAVVSTVFLGVDHNFMRFHGNAAPHLFETMIFWVGAGGYEQDRCSTWAQAEAMHAFWVKEVSSPRLYFAHLLRQVWETVDQAWRELKEAIREAA